MGTSQRRSLAYPNLVYPINVHQLRRTLRSVFQRPTVFQQFGGAPATGRRALRAVVGIERWRRLGACRKDESAKDNDGESERLHRSTSPNTMSIDPRIAETSAS